MAFKQHIRYSGSYNFIITVSKAIWRQRSRLTTGLLNYTCFGLSKRDAWSLIKPKMLIVQCTAMSEDRDGENPNSQGLCFVYGVCVTWINEIQVPDGM